MPKNITWRVLIDHEVDVLIRKRRVDREAFEDVKDEAQILGALFPIRHALDGPGKRRYRRRLWGKAIRKILFAPASRASAAKEPLLESTLK